MIAGQAAGVEAAAAVIEAVIAENYTVTLTIEDPDVVGLLVGKKGESIKKFQVRWLWTHTALTVRRPVRHACADVAVKYLG